VTEQTIHRVAVLGAGTMGHGIAQVCAMAGCGVALHDPQPGAVERGLRQITQNLVKGVERGKVDSRRPATAPWCCCARPRTWRMPSTTWSW
jgi:3-hydroxybutyryl-CoA dehydrogenase